MPDQREAKQVLLYVWGGPVLAQPYRKTWLADRHAEQPEATALELDAQSDETYLGLVRVQLADATAVRVHFCFPEQPPAQIARLRQLIELLLKYRNKVAVTSEGSHPQLSLMLKHLPGPA
jgi:hypothetical protein